MSGAARTAEQHAASSGICGAALPAGMLPEGRGPWLEVLVWSGFVVVATAWAVRVCQQHH